MLAFILWAILGLSFVVYGIYVFRSDNEKAFGFWANAHVAPVTDVKGYNRALGKLWCVYGAVCTLLGLPLLAEDSQYIIISILGLALSTIVVMGVYTIKIEGKYRKK